MALGHLYFYEQQRAVYNFSDTSQGYSKISQTVNILPHLGQLLNLFQINYTF